jgi:flagellin
VQAQKGKNKEIHTMALSILNNISSLSAENALSNTQASLQKTLTQLSTGLKINSGSDDAAGLSIAQGMQANISALTQSEQNASNGIGMLQTADGALSQVTSLLNRAVTLATEASTTGITTTQAAALNTEFTSIKAEIDQIGSSTNFNGANVFTANTATGFTSSQSNLETGTLLQNGSVTTITDLGTGSTFNFTAGAASTVGDLMTAIGAAVTDGQLSAGTTVTGPAAATPAALVITDGSAKGMEITTNDTTLGALNATTAANNTSTVFISDGQTATVANNEVTTSISTLSSAGLLLSTKDLSNAADAQSALTTITAAINTVSAQRGQIGASVNRLTAASANMSNEVTNLQSAANSIQNADIGKTVANMTQYNVLQSTGMAALQQSNQAQQAVLKLVQ